MTVTRGKKSGTLYMIAYARCSIVVTVGNETYKLWHQRLGHMSEKGMKILHLKGKLLCLQSLTLRSDDEARPWMIYHLIIMRWRYK